MIKWILFSAVFVLQAIGSVAFANKTISSKNFNTLIDQVNSEQIETAHVIWNSEKVNDYLRKKRTLQNIKTMIADSNSATSDP